MSEYKNIIGTHIKTVTTDPPNPENGQMWYNSTTRVVKGFTSNPAGAWATSGSINSARDTLAGSGAQTNAIIFGGQAPNVALTESYNGSSWTEVNDLNTAKGYLGGFGSVSAAIKTGGLPSTAATESWNGTSWTEVNDLNTARFGSAGGGTQASAVAAAGSRATPAALVSEDWSLPVTSTVTFTVS